MSLPKNLLLSNESFRQNVFPSKLMFCTSSAKRSSISHSSLLSTSGFVTTYNLLSGIRCSCRCDLSSVFCSSVACTSSAKNCFNGFLCSSSLSYRRMTGLCCSQPLSCRKYFRYSGTWFFQHDSDIKISWHLHRPG